MSKPSPSKTSKRAATPETDRRRIHAMGNADIDLSDSPEVTAEMAAHGVVRVAGKAVPRGKQRLTMYLDTAIVEYFKARAGTKSYQTLKYRVTPGHRALVARKYPAPRDS